MSWQSIVTGWFAHRIDGMQPRIAVLKQPLTIVGMAVDTDLKRIYRDVPALGGQYKKYKQTHEIPNRRQPWAFAAVSRNFDRTKGTFSYFLGDVVTNLDRIPAGLTSMEIPAIRYAVFPVRPKNRFGWGIAIAAAKRYIYNVWLPSSGYLPAGVIDDFEFHDGRSVRKSNPEIDLYVAIREKD